MAVYGNNFCVVLIKQGVKGKEELNVVFKFNLLSTFTLTKVLIVIKMGFIILYERKTRLQTNSIKRGNILT